MYKMFVLALKPIKFDFMTFQTDRSPRIRNKALWIKTAFMKLLSLWHSKTFYLSNKYSFVIVKKKQKKTTKPDAREKTDRTEYLFVNSSK